MIHVQVRFYGYGLDFKVTHDGELTPHRYEIVLIDLQHICMRAWKYWPKDPKVMLSTIELGAYRTLPMELTKVTLSYLGKDYPESEAPIPRRSRFERLL
jgi:hypothetical protein